MSLAPVTYVSTFRSKDLEKTKFIQVLADHTENMKSIPIQVEKD